MDWREFALKVITQYYGVDWLLFALVLTHLWLLGERRRVAWLVGVAAVSTALVLGLLIGSVATTTMNACFVFMHIRNYLRWGEEQRKVVFEET